MRPCRFAWLLTRQSAVRPVALLSVMVALVACALWIKPAAAQDGTPPTAPPTSHKQAPQHVKPVGVVSSVADGQLDSPDIIGGEIAEEGAWPWQVALIHSNVPDAFVGQFCGGTLIAPSWVVTAAHCVEGLPSGEGSVDVLLDRNVLSGTGGERIAADTLIVHPDYDILTLDSDVALLYLATPSTQTPISLDAPDEEALAAEGALAMVTGWGRFSADSGLGSNELRQVELPLVPRPVCGAQDAWGDMITDNMICAGYEEGDRSACHGDSGGPLMVEIEDEPGWAQIGVVSWGSSTCNEFNRYNVYTRISQFQDWIAACQEDARSVACRGDGFVGDVFEPDGDQTLSRDLPLDAPGERHTFHRPQDNDWFQFDAEVGRTYVIYTYDLERRSDTVLWLFDQDGLTVLRYNDDRNVGYPSGEYGSDSLASAIYWTPKADGTYYVAVLPFSTLTYGNRTGYHIRAAELTATRYLPLVRY